MMSMLMMMVRLECLQPSFIVLKLKMIILPYKGDPNDYVIFENILIVCFICLVILQ